MCKNTLNQFAIILSVILFYLSFPVKVYLQGLGKLFPAV